jgi:protein required for attachment to host cells
MLKESAMKTRTKLFLLAADQDFRLLRSDRSGMTEISHSRADEFADVMSAFSAEQSRSHASGVSFGVNDPGTHESEERRRFARHALAALEREWAGGRDEGIVLVAGPKMLGVLRDLLPKALAGHVTAELPKTLVDVPTHDLPGHFAGLSRV